jgi:multisubunit Na+/H+ antiporter MnhG subunit
VFRFPTGGLWRQPEFLKLWVGASISSLGSQVTILALPLTAVLLFGAGPAETGLLTAAGTAPMLLFVLVAGPGSTACRAGRAASPNQYNRYLGLVSQI